MIRERRRGAGRACGRALRRALVSATLLLAFWPHASRAAPAPLLGPAVLPLGGRESYRVSLAGDPAASACDLVLVVALPGGFSVARASRASSLDAPSGVLRFAPVERLGPGEDLVLELELRAPSFPAAGPLCLRLEYDGCPAEGTRDLGVSAGCFSLATAAPAGGAPQVLAEFTTFLPRSCARDVPLVVELDASASTSPVGIGDPDGYRWAASRGRLLRSDGRTTVLYLEPSFFGSVTVDLEVEDLGGFIDRAQQTFDIHPGPRVVLAPPPFVRCTDPAADLLVALDASGSISTAGIDDPQGFDWSVTGPGTLSSPAGSLSTLTVAAGTTGIVTARVEVTDRDGCDAAASADYTFLPVPVACLRPGPVAACAGPGETIRFPLDAGCSATSGPIGPALTYVWTSSVPSLTPLLGPAPTLTLPPGTAGPVDVTLEVRDGNSCGALTTRRLTVTAAPILYARTVPESACAVTGEETVFALEGASAAPGAPAGVWTTTEPRATVIPTGPGRARLSLPAGLADDVPVTYTLPLTAACTRSLDLVARVLAPPSARLAAVPAPVCRTADSADVALDASLSRASGPGGITSYAFALTGPGVVVGTGGAQAIARYPALTPGDLTATVTVRDGNGCSATATETFRLPLAEGPVARILATPAPPGSASLFRAEVTGGTAPFSYRWEFGDGSPPADAESPTHVYASPGTFSVTLLLTDATACATSDSFALHLPEQPDGLVFGKTARSRLVTPGGDAAFAITLTARAALRVVLEDRLPEGLRYRANSARRNGASMAEPIGSYDLIFPALDLEQDETAVVEYRAEVAPDAAAGDYENLAWARATDAYGRTFDMGPRQATVTIVEGAGGAEGDVDLRVTKRAEPSPSPAEALGFVRYRIDVENRGPAVATRVVLADDWPAGEGTIEDNEEGGVLLGSRIRWELEALAPGAAQSVRYSVRLRAGLSAGSVVRNVVQASSREPEREPRDNRASAEVVVGGSADLAISKAVAVTPYPPAPGSLATYTLAYRNRGAAARAASIADDYDETRIELVSLPAGATDEGGMLRIALGDLAPGAEGAVAYTARVRADASGGVANTARISSAIPDADPSNDIASARFDVATVPATLSLLGEIERATRCGQAAANGEGPGEIFETAPVLLAAAASLRAAVAVAAEAESAPPVLAASRAALARRLLRIGRVNVEGFLLRSGMGAGAAVAAGAAGDGSPAPGAGSGDPGRTPLAIPSASAHAPRGDDRAPGEPWCAHEEHRSTGLRVIGAALDAVAAHADAASALGDEAMGLAARELMVSAGETLRTLAAWRTGGVGGAAPGPLPSRLVPARSGASSAPGARLRASSADWAAAIEPVPSRGSASVAADRAVVVRGLARLARAAERAGHVAPEGLAGSVEALLVISLDDLLRDLGGGGALGAAGTGHGLAPVEAAEVAEAIEATRSLVRAEDRFPTLELLARPEAAPARAGGDAPPGVPELPSLDADLARARIHLAAGERPRAQEIWRRLEATSEDLPFGTPRHRPGTRAPGPSPARLGAVVETLSGLLAGADAAESEELHGRLALTVHAPAGEPARTLLLVAGTATPAAMDGGRFAGPPGTCRVAEALLEDGRFDTETGLLAVAGIDSAGRVLRSRARTTGDEDLADLADRYLAAAGTIRGTVGLLSGMGIRMGFAGAGGGREGERDRIARLASEAGLTSVPESLLPVWLELDGGDPSFGDPLDGTRPYAVGWDPTRVAPSVRAEALGQALRADALGARASLERGDAPGRFEALVALHAATLKAALVASELREAGDLGALEPVLDAEGRPLALRRPGAAGTLRGHVALLRGLTALRTIPGQALPAAALVETADAIARLLELSERDLEREGAADAVALAEAAAAFDEVAREEPALASRATAVLVAVRRALGGLPSSPSLSPLARDALGLLAAARLGGSAADLGARLREIAALYEDTAFGLLRSGRSGAGDREGSGGAGALESDVLTDVDVGALLSALAESLPLLEEPDREAAVRLLRGPAARVLFETGLVRTIRAELRHGELTVGARTQSIARSVRITVAEPAALDAAVYPGDRVLARFTAGNPTPASAAEAVTLELALGPGLRLLEGPASDGAPATGGPAGNGVVRLPIGRLGGGEQRDVRLVAEVVEGAPAGLVHISARALARSGAGPDAVALATAPVVHPVAIGSLGRIEGRVLGRREGGAPPTGIPGVTVVLDEGHTTTTDADGTYRMERLRPATYRVRVLGESLRSELRAEGDNGERIRVLPGETAIADLGVRTLSVASGIVFRDLDGDRRHGADEPVVSGVVVESSGPDGARTSITDGSGRYVLRGVATGSHRLRIAARQPHVEEPADLRLQPLPLP